MMYHKGVPMPNSNHTFDETKLSNGRILIVISIPMSSLYNMSIPQSRCHKDCYSLVPKPIIFWYNVQIYDIFPYSSVLSFFGTHAEMIYILIQYISSVQQSEFIVVSYIEPSGPDLSIFQRRLIVTSSDILISYGYHLAREIGTTFCTCIST